MDKVIYYKDELNDDFAVTKNHKKKKIDHKYNYHKDSNILWAFFAFLIYYFIVKPLTHFIMVFGYHYKIINKKCLKEAKKRGGFIYSNHTNYMPDAFIPNHLIRRKTYIVVDPTAVSIRGLGNLVVALGAIPLGDTIGAKKNFLKSIKKHSNKSLVTIYPEAHIWPYYTGIRNFTKDSIKYPIICNTPSYTVTNCYQKRRFSKKPKIISYVDGPFYPDESLERNEKVDKLYNDIISVMKNRTNMYSTYEYVKYIKVSENEVL